MQDRQEDLEGQYRDFAGDLIPQGRIDADWARMRRGMQGPMPPSPGGPNPWGIPGISRVPPRARRVVEARRKAAGGTVRLSVRELRDLSRRLPGGRSRPRAAGPTRQARPRARRTGPSSATSGSDPGEGGDSEPPGDATSAPLRPAQLAEVVS